MAKNSFVVKVTFNSSIKVKEILLVVFWPTATFWHCWTYLVKLEHIGVRGITNEWFKSYLSNRKQFALINHHDSNLVSISYGVPQGLFLSPLLFSIYINNLNQAIHFCKVHHFADNTNLLHSNKSIAKLNKFVSHDMKSLVEWLNTRFL